MSDFGIAVVGCGGMANTWVKYAKERADSEIVALVDIKRENAEKMKNEHKLSAAIFEDLSQAITESEPNIVFDVTTPASHKQIVTTALKAGCNVFGEKPMASSLEECRDMLKTAQETEKMYAVMQNRRYLKDIRAFRELLASGVIGDNGFITADFFIGPHFGGFRDVMESPLILDMAIHTFDQARFLMEEDPVSVYCLEFNPPGSWYEGDAAAVATYEFSDGSVFSYRGSWCAEGAPTSWESNWRITGSKGTALWDGSNEPYAEIVKPTSEDVFTNEFKKIAAEYSWDDREGHQGCLDEMFSALKEGRKAETDCTDNIKSMAMVFAALESSRRQEKVSISRDGMSIS